MIILRSLPICASVVYQNNSSADTKVGEGEEKVFQTMEQRFPCRLYRCPRWSRLSAWIPRGAVSKQVQNTASLYPSHQRKWICLQRKLQPMVSPHKGRLLTGTAVHVREPTHELIFWKKLESMGDLHCSRFLLKNHSLREGPTLKKVKNCTP